MERPELRVVDGGLTLALRALAGTRYVVAIKSGGFRVKLSGGGMLGRGSFLVGVGRRLTTPESSMRAYALSQGSVVIKDVETDEVVCSRRATDLPMGADISRLVEEVERDLETLTVEQFQRHWGIATEN
jgi:hypothetical protein